MRELRLIPSYVLAGAAVFGLMLLVGERVVIVALLSFAAVIGYVVHRIRKAGDLEWERKIKGLCQRCGYDLRGSPGRCPECGTAHPRIPGR